MQKIRAVLYTTMPTYFSYLDCAIGRIRLRASDEGLIAVDHENQQECTPADWIEDQQHPVLLKATSELTEYFAGSRKAFNIPLSPVGTVFQLQVWDELSKIPYGQIVSYSTIAERINNPKSVRAVGAANGRNPLSIFVPCHRVTGKNGKLSGYAGGLENKQILLDLESRFAPIKN